MNNNEYTMPSNSYWVTNAVYNGMSNKDKQHALINKKTGERVLEHSMSEIARGTKLKNVKIPTAIARQLA